MHKKIDSADSNQATHIFFFKLSPGKCTASQALNNDV